MFDIYLEDLILTISVNAALSYEEILVYSDDLLVLSDDITKIRKTIVIVEEWSGKNGMRLNKQKSAVAEFVGRSQKKLTLVLC